MEAESSDGTVRLFVHPFLQALAMFLGEILCLVAFKSFYYFFRSKGVSIIHYSDMNWTFNLRNVGQLFVKILYISHHVIHLLNPK